MEKSTQLTGKEFRFTRRHLLWTLSRAAELLDFNSPQYISGRENSDDPFFARRPLDYVWRLLCLEEFIETAESSLRKSQAEEIRTALVEKARRHVVDLKEAQGPTAVEILRSTKPDLEPPWEARRRRRAA